MAGGEGGRQKERADDHEGNRQRAQPCVGRSVPEDDAKQRGREDGSQKVGESGASAPDSPTSSSPTQKIRRAPKRSARRPVRGMPIAAAI